MRTEAGIAALVVVALTMIAPMGARAMPYDGGGGGPATVGISNVNIDRNSLSGTLVTITWQTFPDGATSTFQYKAKTVTTWTKVTPNCGPKCVALTGLTNHADYDFLISASYPGWYTGYYQSVFYPTDVSLSSVYENYRVDYDYGPCNWPLQNGLLQYYPKGFMAGDVVHRLHSTNANDWTPHYIYTHIDAHSPSGCVGMRHTTVTIFAYDDTQPFSTKDVWLQGLDVFPRTADTFAMGTVSYSITFGAEYKGVGFSASAQWSCPSQSCVYSYQKWWGAYPWADGSLMVGQTSIEWNPTSTNALDVVFLLKVSDVLAQKHYLDKLRFAVVFDLTFDAHGWCGIPPFQIPFTDCWVPFGEKYATYKMILGDGKVNDPTSGSADQFTDLQDGTQAIQWNP